MDRFWGLAGQGISGELLFSPAFLRVEAYSPIRRSAFST